MFTGSKYVHCNLLYKAAVVCMSVCLYPPPPPPPPTPPPPPPFDTTVRSQPNVTHPIQGGSQGDFWGSNVMNCPENQHFVTPTQPWCWQFYGSIFQKCGKFHGLPRQLIHWRVGGRIGLWKGGNPSEPWQPASKLIKTACSCYQ